MSDPSVSAAAFLLRPVARAAFAHVSRLRAERQAAQSSVRSRLLQENLNDTLSRLRGPTLDVPWWSNILRQLGQEYITPDFLKKPSLREWLGDEEVAKDVKKLATDILMGASGHDTQSRSRLVKSYSDHTGELSQFAEVPIDVTVAILVAGYITSIPADQRPLAGMFQQLFGHFNERFDRLEENRLSNLEESASGQLSAVQQFFTERAAQELSTILSLRGFNASRSREAILALLDRIRDGELIAVSAETKETIKYWTARLCATESNTLNIAKQLRDELEQTNPDLDLVIVHSLIAEKEGDVDQALRLLRDPDDANSRTAWFGLLCRVRSNGAAMDWFEDQNDRHNPEFFTPLGWCNWAICASELEQWEKASEQLPRLEQYWSEMPSLPLVEGNVNSAMLLPFEFRKRALEGVPLYQGVRPNQGTKAEHHHSRAMKCFYFVEQSIRDTEEQSWKKVVSDWKLWLKLMHPNDQGASIAREEVCHDMKNGGRAVKLIPFAYAFEILFDSAPLRKHLEQRKTLGGLDDDEVLAECFLFAESMTPREFVDYLEQYEGRLSEVVAPQLLAAMHINSLMNDNQSTEKVREVLEKYGAVDKDHLDRLFILIGAHEGKDPREGLEERYRQTGSLIDLQNLVSHLKMVGDRAALRPLLLTQFNDAPTVNNALDVVICLSDPNSYDDQRIIQFLEQNADLVQQSDELQTAKAVALFHAGRLEGARKVNDSLLADRTNPENLRLDLRIAVTSGDWERIGGILNSAWTQRESYEAETLLAFATLAGQQGQMQERAVQLARLAVEKAPNNPQILAAAYWQHFKLGRDEDAEPAWLLHATELSSPEEGPIWRADLRDVATQWLPKRRDHLQEVERKWIDGEMPMSLAAGRFNVSLARLLLHVPEQNANEPDGRRRVILPIVAGARNAIKVLGDWTIGLDITSVLVLSYLGVLDRAIDAFGHVKLAPEIMEHLFEERDEVRFHQPSRIKAAKQVLELQRREHLVAADGSVMASQAIVEEVGRELAELLQTARDNDGKVICVLPVYKAGSLMERKADTEPFDDLIVSLMDFCNLLRDRGRIGEADYGRVQSFLHRQGQRKQNILSPSILDGPIYMDGLALRYLLDAEVLQPIATVGTTIKIHPEIVQEMRALSEEEDTGQGLIASIESIRDVLRSAIAEDKASLLPRGTEHGRQFSKPDMRFQATASLLEGSERYDAVCVDDRFINNHAGLTGSSERSIPILCVLDVLRHLVARGTLEESDHRRARHKLRQGGFSFIPLESGELLYWLKDSNCIHGNLIEGVELRVLRQTAARADSLELSNWQEAFSLTAQSRAACSQAIFDLWEDGEIESIDAASLSHWTWRNVMATTIPGRRILAQESYRNLMRETLSLRVGSLLLPLPSRPQERHDHYAEWIEQSILQPLWPANSDRIAWALSSARDAIVTLEIDQAAYGNLFLASLPEDARRLMINADPEFARKCGYRSERVFNIGTTIKLTDTKLFRTADLALSTSAEQVIQDVTGNDVRVSLGVDSQNVVIGWVDTDDKAKEIEVPSLSLLSSNPESRAATLTKLIDDLGPTATDFRHLLVDVRSRKPTHQELSAIFDEAANGVAAVQSRFIQRIESRLPLGVDDLIPSSLDYFERFSGPCPGDVEPDTYLQKNLPIYRRDLLRRDLRTGLDICCLGALHDDLSPGRWVVGIDNDAISNVLSFCRIEDNPFSLLAALDIGLYRLDDARFQSYAEDAICQLLDEECWSREGCDIYRLLQVFTDFLFNRINLMEDGSLRPKYWKRMGAWMHAGHIVRTMARSTTSVDIAGLQEWTLSNMIAAGAYSTLLDARKEPMSFADGTTADFLKQEVYGRLRVLIHRHKSEGRELPTSTKVNNAMEKTKDRGLPLSLGLPGPLEGHRRPTQPMPSESKKALVGVWAEGADPWHALVTASHYFALEKEELDNARTLVKKIATEVAETDALEYLRDMELASIVAATNRDPELADGIAHALVQISPRVKQELEVEVIFGIILQSAAAREAYEEWFQWLEEKLADIAAALPISPKEILRTFLRHLDEIEIVSPAGSWFHIRARSVALAGVV